eukprot:2569231-Alexandrium_andersonii.AAC.1
MTPGRPPARLRLAPKPAERIPNNWAKAERTAAGESLELRRLHWPQAQIQSAWRGSPETLTPHR